MTSGTASRDEAGLLELVGSIYEAALEPERWDGVLRSLALAVGAERGLLAPGPPPSAQAELLGAFELDGDAFRPYYEHYGPRDPLMPMGTTFAPDEPFDTQMLLARSGMGWAEFRRTEIYGEFLRELGTPAVLGGHLPLDRNTFAALGLYRRKEEGWDAAEHALLRRVLPHLHRALQLVYRMDLLRDRLAATRELVDALACGAILVDGRGRILQSNRKAHDLATAGDGLRLASEGISASHGPSARRLRRLVLDAARTGAGRGSAAGGAVALERPSGRRPLQAFVSPLARRGAARRWGTGACALVLVSDPEETPPPCEELLRGLWGLTHAEARVAAEVASGADLDRVGDALGIRRETVRNHLKRIYEKTDTHRQAELVRLVHALPARRRPG